MCRVGMSREQAQEAQRRQQTTGIDRDGQGWTGMGKEPAAIVREQA